MKNPLLLLLALVVAALIIAGFVFLTNASGSSGLIQQEARQPALISGMTCLFLGTGLLVLGIFQFRKRD